MADRPPSADEGPRGEGARRWRPSLGGVLTATLLVAVIATAILVHFSWTAIARANLRDLVDQLNDKIALSVKQEIHGVVADATAAQEALRTIFFQNVIATTDEAKREFVFLSLLQSQPNLSWVAFGFPNGDFFGAQKTAEDSIQMVEVRHDEATGLIERRVDLYRSIVGDIEFQERQFDPSDYDSRDQPWYANAQEAEGSVWTNVWHFPTAKKAGIAISRRLEVFRDFKGVMTMVIEIDRLSRFLGTIAVGRTGTVLIVDDAGNVVAAPEMYQKADSESAEMELGANDNQLFAVAEEALARYGMGLEEIHGTMPMEFSSEVSGEDYIVTFSPLDFNGWLIATIVPTADFLAEVERKTRLLGLALLGFTALIAALATWLGRRMIANPMQAVTGELRHLEAFEPEKIKARPSPIREIDRLSTALTQMASGLISFKKYLPTEVVRTLVAQGIEARPGGDYRPITVLFTDLVGFTRLSEKLGNDIVPLLAEHLGAMSHAIHDEGGTIDKFIGDSIMAFWGAPIARADHAAAACRAALACQTSLAAMRAEAVRRGTTPLQMRIGINSGTILVGNIGSEERLNYTALGDPVNVASRLEALNKRYDSAILIGEATRREAGDAIIVRKLDRVAVYGREGGLDIYELLAAAETMAQRPDWVTAYEAALERFWARDFAAAAAGFAAADRQRPGGDKPARDFAQRAEAFRLKPPPEDWRGVTILDEK